MLECWKNISFSSIFNYHLENSLLLLDENRYLCIPLGLVFTLLLLISFKLSSCNALTVFRLHFSLILDFTSVNLDSVLALSLSLLAIVDPSHFVYHFESPFENHIRPPHPYPINSTVVGQLTVVLNN